MDAAPLSIFARLGTGPPYHAEKPYNPEPMQPFLASHQMPAFAAAVPLLDTERLTLRCPWRDDLEDSVALRRDPEVCRFIGGPLGREEVWARMLRHLGHWAALGYGNWVVRERQSGRFVGEIGLFDLQRQMVPALDAPEAGWVLAPWCHGKGFATEAVAAVLAWSEQALRAPRIVCIINPENTPSLKVAARCGFTRYAETTYHGAPILLMERATAAPILLMERAAAAPPGA